MDAIKMRLGFGLWPACHPSQRLHQLAFYAEAMIPYVEVRQTPVASVSH